MKRSICLLTVFVACLAPAAVAHAEASFGITALEPASAIPQDVAAGDLDGANGPDIVTAYHEGGISVNLNNGDGTFGPAHPYPTGCDTEEVELADLGGVNNDNAPDGHLDAAIVCASGEAQYLGRLAGDGSGGFGVPDLVPALSYGFPAASGPQVMALVDVRGAGLPPVPALSYASHDPFHGTYSRVLCFTYDWATENCIPYEVGPLFVAGVVADARLFTTGGAKGILAWGPDPEWHSSTRELASVPPGTTGQNFQSLTIGDLAGDGPDIISAAGSCGCGYQDIPPTGVVDISYGNTAAGVPDQTGTTFPSAPGVLSIATGDFDLDGHTDLIGDNWSYDPATRVISGGVFVQAGNGAGGLAAPQMIPISNSETFSHAPIRVADFDRNGAPDATSIVGGKVQVLLNHKSPAAAVKIGKLDPLAGIKGLPKTVRPDKKGIVLLGTATNPPTASVDLTITIPAKSHGKARAAATKPKQGKKKRVLIGHALIRIPTGQKAALKVHLKASALKKLKKAPLRATLAVLAAASDGTKKATSQALTIKPATTKKHKRS
jgi:hypothetical protein